ncbi:MAG: hypothetical protein KGJ37_06460, partial [Verrucomicrobiota bacterium]|nr:hypothetical protein [Verrucomicrobiota bacterium]
YVEFERVAVVAPRLREERLPREDCRWLKPHPRWSWLFRRVPCREDDLSGVTFVITSGTLMDLRAYRRIGPMDEKLFIDYIDHDYCLRARNLGYEILVSYRAVLLHNLGAKRRVEVAGRSLRPTFHSEIRHYYMARNRILMWRRYARRFPHWWLFDACFGVLNVVRVLLAEDKRTAKLAAMLRGIWHGLLGRTGPMPP